MYSPLIEFHSVVEIAVTACLALWLAAGILTALRGRPFWSPMFSLRLVEPWRMFETPQEYYHTLEYREETALGTEWVVAGSTRYDDRVPFLSSRTSLVALHLFRVITRLERALRQPEDADAKADIEAIEENLLRHPAIRLLATRPLAMRIVQRRGSGRAADDAVLKEWIPGIRG